MTKTKPRLSLIASMSKNRVIGRSSKLPWHLPADLARFRSITMHKPVIMGRKTWDSLPRRLDGRINIVVTRNSSFWAGADCMVVASPLRALAEARALGSDEILVIGGESIYRALIPVADRLYLTIVDTEIEDGDASFPEWDPTEWIHVEQSQHSRDEKIPYDYLFLTLDRRV